MASPFKFNIDDVVNALGLVIRKTTDSSFDCDCPFCDQTGVKFKPGKLHIWRKDDTFSCLRCEAKGGALQLYCDVKGVDKKTGRKEMYDFINADYKKQESYFSKNKRQPKEAVKRASNEVLDKVYRRFLSLCTLEDKHKENLLKRGLNEKQIVHYGFKTVPTHRMQHNKIISTLLLENYNLEGVPGFFVNKKGDWDFNLFRYAEGFLIPILSVDRKVRGFQIRLDKPKEGKGKYFWFASSNKNKGTGSSSPIHLTNPIGMNTTKTVFLTEGSLKADIAHSLSGMTFVAIAGVTVQKNLPKYLAYLKKIGVLRIVDCFDSDAETNINVQHAQEKLARKVMDAGLSYSRMTWDKRYKGIDDYLQANDKSSWRFRIKEI